MIFNFLYLIKKKYLVQIKKILYKVNIKIKEKLIVIYKNYYLRNRLN